MAMPPVHLPFPVRMVDPLPLIYGFPSAPCRVYSSASTGKVFSPLHVRFKLLHFEAQSPVSFSSSHEGEQPVFVASHVIFRGQNPINSGKPSSACKCGKDSASDHSSDSNIHHSSVCRPGTSNRESHQQFSCNQTFPFPTSGNYDKRINENAARPNSCASQKQERFLSGKNQTFLRVPSEQGASLSTSKAHFAVQGKGVTGEHREHQPHEKNLQSFQEKDDGLAISRIAEKLRSLKSSINANSTLPQPSLRTPSQLYVPVVGDSVLHCLDNSWTTPDHPIPAPGSSFLVERKFPWEKTATDAIEQYESESEKPMRVKPPSLAELLIPQPELKRLRNAGFQLEKSLKIGRLGVTDGIVSGIHERWRNSELVKVRYGGSAQNMKKLHQDLERKTGGLVISRSGSVAVVYRGKDYSGPVSMPTSFMLSEEEEKALMEEEKDSRKEDGHKHEESSTVSFKSTFEEIQPLKSEDDDTDLFSRDFEYEVEMDRFLDNLGPRYKDWTGFRRPVPVDGDLLPSVDANYKPPFRILPYGVHPKLSNLEMTNLRRVARPLAPHFVVGRNRGHQGLAMAVIKLWEKCEVAKIAIKRGVQNTNDQLMAEELKLLTGGMLLARDKEFIVLYRGKDFLPQALAEVLREREHMTKVLLDGEKNARNGDSVLEIKANDNLRPTLEGTIPEVSDIKEDNIRIPNVGLEIEGADEQGPTSAIVVKEKVESSTSRNCDDLLGHRIPPAKAVPVLEAQTKERQLAISVRKKMKAEEELQKFQKMSNHLSDPPIDQEVITEEEKNMLRKLGLKMQAFLLVGRRGVFDGVIENMHLHWKHRELVKLIYKGKDKGEIEETTKTLANESGGILIGIVPTSKGQAIIVYRGKNYQRPPRLRPTNLLTKREALKRFTEGQRQESLERNLLRLEKQISDLKVDLIMQKSIDKCTLTDPDSGSCVELVDGINKEADMPPIEQLHTKKDVTRRKGLGPIFRADRLTNKEKLVLRKQALKLGKPAHFHVGKSNVMAGLTRSIRVYFQHHSLVKVGVKGRARGTSVAEIIQELEEGTGAVLVSLEPCKLIFYRGWPEGQDQPSSSYWPEDIPSGVIEAIKVEDGDFDDDIGSSFAQLDESDIGEYSGNT